MDYPAAMSRLRPRPNLGPTLPGTWLGAARAFAVSPAFDDHQERENRGRRGVPLVQLHASRSCRRHAPLLAKASKLPGARAPTVARMQQVRHLVCPGCHAIFLTRARIKGGSCCIEVS